MCVCVCVCVCVREEGCGRGGNCEKGDPRGNEGKRDLVRGIPLRIVKLQNDT